MRERRASRPILASACGSSTFSHAVDLKQSVGSFASIQTLDLQLVGDAATGTITGYYSINGGTFTKLSKTITLSSGMAHIARMVIRSYRYR